MKKICIITGSRAEYGLLFNLIKKIKDYKNFKLQIIATCMHLLPKYGLTYKEIIKDGFKIDCKVKMPLLSSKPENISAATGIGMVGFSKAYLKLKPDLVVVLGDRFEILSAAFAALSQKIPIAHIHGGESTFGAIDEAIRHSVTKMSTWHFPATNKYRKRIIQMGENPKNIFVVGSLGVDRIKKTKLFSKSELEKKINFKFDKPTFLITYHPETLGKNPERDNVKALLSAVNSIKNIKAIFTLPNVDSGSDIIISMIKRFVKMNKERFKIFKSMGDTLYLSAMKHSQLVLGNSSSGIIEAPTLKKPTVNIGDRQEGRIKAGSIINSNANKLSIIKNINQALSNEFKKKIGKIKNPYEVKNTSEKIFSIIKKIKLNKVPKKKFYDLSTK